MSFLPMSLSATGPVGGGALNLLDEDVGTWINLKMPQSGFPCPICFVKFDKPASLGQHILSSHSEENNDDQQEERIEEHRVTPGEQDASGMIIDTVFPDAFSI